MLTRMRYSPDLVGDSVVFSPSLLYVEIKESMTHLSDEFLITWTKSIQWFSED